MWQLVVDPEVLLQMGTALGEEAAWGAERIILKTKIFVVFLIKRIVFNDLFATFFIKNEIAIRLIRYV